MSPKAPDPRIRTSLIEAAARILAEEGTQALTTRRLAAELGTSTMAVYTYFEGMDDLRLAVRKEGFLRLSRLMDQVGRMEDPVAYVAALGGAYFINGVMNPNIYKVMFEEHPGEGKAEVGLDTLERLVAAVQAAIDARRFEDRDAFKMATQLWSAGHGIVMLNLAGALTIDEAIETFSELGLNLFVAFGDTWKNASKSGAAATDHLFSEWGPIECPVRDTSTAREMAQKLAQGAR